jgi:hypothetical protein
MTLNNSQGLLTWAADIGFRLFRDQRHISVSVKVSPLRRATTRVAFATLGLSRHADPDRSPGSALYLEARKILASNHKLHRLTRYDGEGHGRRRIGAIRGLCAPRSAPSPPRIADRAPNHVVN